MKDGALEVLNSKKIERRMSQTKEDGEDNHAFENRLQISEKIEASLL